MCTEILRLLVLDAVAADPGLDAHEIGHKRRYVALEHSRVPFYDILGHNLSFVVVIHHCKSEWAN